MHAIGTLRHRFIDAAIEQHVATVGMYQIYHLPRKGLAIRIVHGLFTYLHQARPGLCNADKLCCNPDFCGLSNGKDRR